LLANRADTLDAVQDTYVVALLRLGDLRDVAAVRGWLHRVVRNNCLMRLRQQREIVTTDIEVCDTACDSLRRTAYGRLTATRI
jgi:DNA-directed RNA polymerase specialized sigma24 family protein